MQLQTTTREPSTNRFALLRCKCCLELCGLLTLAVLAGLGQLAYVRGLAQSHVLPIVTWSIAGNNAVIDFRPMCLTVENTTDFTTAMTAYNFTVEKFLTDNEHWLYGYSTELVLAFSATVLMFGWLAYIFVGVGRLPWANVTGGSCQAIGLVLLCYAGSAAWFFVLDLMWKTADWRSMQWPDTSRKDWSGATYPCRDMYGMRVPTALLPMCNALQCIPQTLGPEMARLAWLPSLLPAGLILVPILYFGISYLAQPVISYWCRCTMWSDCMDVTYVPSVEMPLVPGRKWALVIGRLMMTAVSVMVVTTTLTGLVYACVVIAHADLQFFSFSPLASLLRFMTAAAEEDPYHLTKDTSTGQYDSPPNWYLLQHDFCLLMGIVFTTLSLSWSCVCYTFDQLEGTRQEGEVTDISYHLLDSVVVRRCGGDTAEENSAC